MHRENTLLMKVKGQSEQTGWRPSGGNRNSNNHCLQPKSAVSLDVHLQTCQTHPTFPSHCVCAQTRFSIFLHISVDENECMFDVNELGIMPLTRSLQVAITKDEKFRSCAVKFKQAI